MTAFPQIWREANPSPASTSAGHFAFRFLPAAAKSPPLFQTLSLRLQAVNCRPFGGIPGKAASQSKRVFRPEIPSVHLNEASIHGRVRARGAKIPEKNNARRRDETRPSEFRRLAKTSYPKIYNFYLNCGIFP